MNDSNNNKTPPSSLRPIEVIYVMHSTFLFVISNNLAHNLSVTASELCFRQSKDNELFVSFVYYWNITLKQRAEKESQTSAHWSRWKEVHMWNQMISIRYEGVISLIYWSSFLGVEWHVSAHLSPMYSIRIISSVQSFPWMSHNDNLVADSFFFILSFSLPLLIRMLVLSMYPFQYMFNCIFTYDASTFTKIIRIRCFHRLHIDCFGRI